VPGAFYLLLGKDNFGIGEVIRTNLSKDMKNLTKKPGSFGLPGYGYIK
jgi:hypothetical protein